VGDAAVVHLLLGIFLADTVCSVSLPRRHHP
jgi:hypothetical protein